MTDDADARGLTVAVTDGAGRPVRAGALAGWLRAVAPARARGHVAIALVADGEMRRMNRRFRGKDRPTDVLSFPSGAPRTGPRLLGDIAIGVGVARRQAKRAGHAYGEELRLLALHGLLHLLGYDHHSDDGAMARLETRLRRKGGLAAGVIERAGRV